MYQRRLYPQQWTSLPTMAACCNEKQCETQWPTHPGRVAAATNSDDELSAARVLLALSPREISSKRSAIVVPKQARTTVATKHHDQQAMPAGTATENLPTIISVPSTAPIEAYPSKRKSAFSPRSGFIHAPEAGQQVSDYSGAEASTTTSSRSDTRSEEESTFSDESSSLYSGGQGDVREVPWAAGCVSLSLQDDTDVLSPLHCFMRRYCVEAFSAAPSDISTPRYGKSHGVKVVAGQVGIRCMYCKHRPSGQRPERAVCYPSTLRNIYHSIETWQRRHSLVCTDIPHWVRKSILELMESSKSRAGGRRQYWEDAARRLGMVDTPHGVRFSRVPGDLGVNLDGTRDSGGTIVVDDEDRQLVTPYLFHLMEQMESCQFAEEDRTGGRSKIKNNKVGFPGMQCKHCQGKAGFGRYFPTTMNALALANSDRKYFAKVAPFIPNSY